MKKIYASIAVVFAVISGAQAQVALPQVDLLALPVIDSNTVLPATGKGISWYSLTNSVSPGDSISALVGGYLGNDGVGLQVGDQWFFTGVGATLSPTGGVFGSVYTVGASGPIDTSTFICLDRDITVTDSINTLGNITNIEADSTTWISLLVPRASLIPGHVYGWFSYIAVWPQDGSAAYRDTIRGNNFAYIPVYWVNNGVGINEAVSTKYDQLALYPNPANNTVSFDLDLKKASQSMVVRVLDITGRAVLTESTGFVGEGKSSHKLDIAKLPVGSYSIQVITEYNISATKFVKN